MRPLTLMTCAGRVSVEVPYCQWRDEQGGWHSPAREAWGLGRNQSITPQLQERLAATALDTPSYEAAARVCRLWGSPIADDSTIARQVGEAGQQARELQDRQEREARIPACREQLIAQTRRELAGRDFSLVIMMDGWMVRHRGEQWGLKPSGLKAERVAWREQKTAIVVRTSECARTAGGRAVTLDKHVVAHCGEWDGLAGKVHAEALRCGLMQAREVFVVADGGVWIWSIKRERFAHATGVLDFYHASQHLWSCARALFGEQGEGARRWVEPLLHQLRHGGEAGVLETLEDLRELLRGLDEQAHEVIEREAAYFGSHADNLHYAAVAERGCPVGSGQMESTCSQLQTRLKRTGQFWSHPGKENLLALELARRNGDWEALWLLHQMQP
jgi:hypothetical protein